MTETPAPLSFDNDKGAARSTWIATALLILIVGWMASGFIIPSEEPEEAQTSTEIQPVAVATQRSEAETVTLFFQAEGQALPDRDTQIRAEASGEIAEVLVSKGDEVADGAVIARLAATRAEADLARTRESLARAQREYDNAATLRERGVATTDRLAQARADLASAEAAFTSATESLNDLVITAPFAGRIETLSLDPGEFVQAGSAVGQIVDNRPLTVAIQVPQQALGRLRNGQTAAVRFITGEDREGRVSFVGTSANAETRTFLTEIEVPNADGAIPAGLSAEVRIPTGEAKAHFVSPSIVSLGTKGELGVKLVGDGEIVEFHTIELARAEIDGIWVTGLPDSARLITIGQGFVNEGEKVRASEEDPS